MGWEIVYLIKFLFFGLAAVIIIPKERYKHFLVYGLFLGGIGDMILIFIFGVGLGLFHYLNMGRFNILNITSFWTPISWTAVVMYFLYALPTKKLFFYLYVLCYGFFGFCVGLILENYGLFKYVGIYRYLAPLVYAGWFYLAARLYMKAEKINLT